MTSENQGMNYGMLEGNVVQNQEATNNPPANSGNNVPNNMGNDDFFRNFIQFVQNQARGNPPNNNGRNNAGNARRVTAKQFKELGPPEFHGKPEPLRAEAWIKQVTKIFDVLRCTDDQKVPFATFMFRGEADHWWESVKRTHHLALEMSWTEFEELFNDKYFPESIRHMKEVEFIKLEQGNMTVSQYEAKFAELSRFAPHLVDNKARMARMFLRGLKPKIRQHLISHKFSLYSEVVDRAQMMEQESEVLQPRVNDQQKNHNNHNNHRNENQRGGNHNFRNGNHFGGNHGQDNRRGESSGNNFMRKRSHNDFERAPASAPAPIFREGDRPPVRCFKCGQEGHISPNCTQPPRKCFSCGKDGHLAKFCPVTKSSPAAMMAPKASTSKPVVQGRAFVVTSQRERNPNEAITGKLLVNSCEVYALLDTGSTHSFISPICA